MKKSQLRHRGWIDWQHELKTYFIRQEVHLPTRPGRPNGSADSLQMKRQFGKQQQQCELKLSEIS